jgi:LuxR family maltose regulon positive regulatory protein
MTIGSLGNQDQTWRAALDLDALETEVHAGHFAEQFDEEAKIDLEVTRSIVEFVSAEHSLRRPDWNALRSETLRARGRLGEDKRLHVAPLATEILLSLRQGRASEAAPLIDDYLLLTQSEKSARGSLDATVFRAMLEFARAELGAAEATARRVVATCLELDGHDESHQATLAHAMLGQIDFLRNNLRAAVSHFEKLGRPEVTSGFEVYSSYYALRALCDAASGRPSDAFERLDNALAHARNWRLPHLALFATAVKCYLEASYSDGDANSSPEAWAEVAEAWRENRGDDSLPWLTRLWLARSLVASFLGKERPADAVTVARQLVEVCASSHQRLISARAWILLGHTLLFAGQRAEGRQAVERALVMTDTTGATRVFLDQGSEVIDVLREVAADKSAGVSDWAARIVGCTSPLELLTPRQKAVLRELAKGGSTKEIARALRLSPETVKTHLRVIFDRLGTSTREGAARAARQAHLASN